MDRRRISPTIVFGVPVQYFTGISGTVLLLAGMLFAALLPVGDAVAQGKTKVVNISNVERVGTLTVSINKSETIKFDKAVSDVVVGSSKIVDVIPMTNQVVYVLGKEIGATNMSLYDEEKQLIAVVDILVSYDIANLQAKLREVLPREWVTVRNLNGKVYLGGEVSGAPAAAQALAIAEQFAPGSVTNGIKVRAPQQVMLEVRFVEATRSAGRELGINVTAVTKNLNVTTGLNLATGSTPFGRVLTNLLGVGQNRIDVLINALEQKGTIRTLAEPNLVALSGDKASFLAGGEFPFPVAQDNNTITIEFKKFGVGLEFTPTVLNDGQINLKIEPEVSQLDTTRTLRLQTIEIPTLVVRRASTTIELRDGQSFAIAGLLQANNTKTLSQLPWVGDVPVLGSLFRSASYQKNETDLVIIVTPRLVKPVTAPGKLATPLDGRRPTNDLDYFLLGKSETPREEVERWRLPGIDVGTDGHIVK